MAKKTLSTQATPANIAAVLALLSATLPQLAELSAPLSAEALRQPLAAGERSFTEEVAHLIHCEARSSQAIYLALLAEEPLLLDLHPERDFGRLWRFDLLDFPDLLAYFRIRRAILLRVLQNLSAAQWGRLVREENKQRKESVYYLARSLALHEAEHIEDLQRKVGV